MEQATRITTTISHGIDGWSAQVILQQQSVVVGTMHYGPFPSMIDAASAVNEALRDRQYQADLADLLSASKRKAA